MTDEQMNRAIAEFLEPKPHEQRSEIKCWTPRVHRSSNFRHLPETQTLMTLEYVPNNFLTDPAMTLLLMEKLRPCSIIIISDSINIQYRTKCDDFFMPHWTGPMEVPIQTAIATAFCRANGINLEAVK